MERSVERKARSRKKGARSSCVCKSSSFSSSRVERCSPSRQTILVYERRLDDISPGGPLEKCSAFRPEPPSSKKCARSMHFLRAVPTSNARWSSLAPERERKCRFSSRIERYPQRWMFLWKRVISANRTTRVKGTRFCHCPLLSATKRRIAAQKLACNVTFNIRISCTPYHTHLSLHATYRSISKIFLHRSDRMYAPRLNRDCGWISIKRTEKMRIGIRGDRTEGIANSFRENVGGSTRIRQQIVARLTVYFIL